MCVEKKMENIINKKNYNQNKAMPLTNGKLKDIGMEHKRGYTLKTIDDDIPCTYCKQWNRSE